MASKTITDDGPNTATTTIDRDGAGAATVTVLIKAGDRRLPIELTQAQLVAALTGPERAAFATALGKLYSAALAAAGFA